MLKDLIKEKYEFIDGDDPIGFGGFGQIFRIRDKKVRTEYILKKLIKKDPNNPMKNGTDKKTFENEVNSLKYVKGKNIINIIDYYSDDKDKFYYIVLEKMDEDLEKLLKEKYPKGMSSKLIRKIFSQINSGLKSILQVGKCHRDLKPSNILISYINEEKTDFIIKIGDFGLITDLNETEYATNAGSKYFKAPEVELEKFSNKCDLYSVGIILYYLKTGEYIFEGKREIEILINKENNKIKKDTDDELLNKLIKKLVVKDPHKRMEWDEYFNDPFFKVNDENNEVKIFIQDKYEYIDHDPISAGTYGSIYRICDKKVKTEYVLKKLRKDDPKENIFGTDKQHFENEIGILKNVKGKNIINIIDYYSDDKFYYIVLEKMDGDLYNLLKKFPKGMSSKLIRKIFSQINSGLKSILDKKKCHRDLNPSNILFSYINDEKTDFIIKIGGFGLSTDLTDTQYASICGTTFYKAPEVEEGKYSNKCDLYSIGIILYILKTGEYIFEGKNLRDILKNKYENKLKKETNDQKLNSLIKKLVVTNPHERMEWKDYFNDPFFKVKD